MSDDEQVHDQLPSVEEYKTHVDPGSRKIDPKRIMESIQPDEDDEDFIPDVDDDLILPPPDDMDEEEGAGGQGGAHYDYDGNPYEEDDGDYNSEEDDDYNSYNSDDDEQVIHDQLPTVEEIHAQRSPQKGPSCARKLGYCFMTLIFLCIVIIPPILLTMKDDYEQRKQEITEFLMTKTLAKGSQLDDPTSPQAKAVEFLATEKYDNSALSDEKLIERYTMTVWYYATNGPKWRYQMRFLSSEDTCGWFSWFRNQRSGQITKEGVICDTPEGAATPAIGLLDMPSNLLEGTIPSELQYLSNSLEQMHVEFNPGLEGELPQELQYLTKLWSLELQYCAITGILPDWLGTKLPLRRLGLSNNLLTGFIPPSLLQQTNLQILALDDNGLTGNIGDFGALIKMQYLYMEDNLIQGQLTNQMLANWTAMKEMDFSRNDISGSLPSDLFTKMNNLEILDLHGNDLAGPLPASIGDNNRIVFLALQDNKLTGEIPVAMSNMIDLQHLDLSRNEISGKIPMELGKLSFLRYLFLGSNSYDAQELPKELAQLTMLRELSIKKANLQGQLPAWIANFTELQLLDLDQNNFQGSIPPEMGDSLSSLDHLMLNRNALNGTIPASFAKLTDLNLLLLDHNELTGSADVVCSIPDLRLYVTDCEAGLFEEAAEIECSCCSTCCHATNATCNMYDWNVNLDPIWEYGYTRYIYTFSQNLIEKDSPVG
eukprot:CAMPEP_0113614126 /NCGR_PEP_ID=MMETSP0017_2-20120614/7000_1 /TAXON_ID=2856 /ORGANISM="Cylindrotheca closterium" /LENGTH=710 /DNA_ID=CAMNT_0000523273 /DNA_START=522 /DNA_END=2654 /DNA_ORIENTATION=- /assembly_acc=CAM_ASM_000147